MKFSFKFYITIISMLMILAQMAADLYLPAMVQMSKVFATDISSMQFTMFCYTIGYLSGALYYGPLSDRIGRKKALCLSLLICMTGSILCVTATTITQIFIGRVIQGLGFGGVNSLARTMIKDVSPDSNSMVKAATILNLFWAVSIAVSPFIGGYIVEYLGWRAEFITLLSFAVLLLLTCYYVLDETNLNRQTTSILTVQKDYKQVFSNKHYLMYAGSSASGFCLLIAYLTYSPDLLIVNLHLTPAEYGYTNILLALGMLLGCLLNGKLAKRKNIDSLIGIGAIIIIIVGAIYSICAMLNCTSVLLVIVPMFIFGAGLLFVLPNTSNGAVSMFSKIAGSAGAAFTFIQMIGGSTGSLLASAIHTQNQLPLGILFIIFGLIIFSCSKLLQKTNVTKTVPVRVKINFIASDLS